MNEIKKFNAVQWVREIRDEFYENHKHLNLKDYINAHLVEANKFKSSKKNISAKQHKRGLKRKSQINS